MKHYTTIEQSKKLLELGLSAESADMWYERIDHELTEYSCNPLLKSDAALYKGLPCWSLGALLEVMPQVSDRFSNYPILVRNRDGLYAFTDKMPFAEKVDTAYYKTSIEAAYNMIVWLFENGYIKKEE